MTRSKSYSARALVRTTRRHARASIDARARARPRTRAHGVATRARAISNGARPTALVLRARRRGFHLRDIGCPGAHARETSHRRARRRRSRRLLRVLPRHVRGFCERRRQAVSRGRARPGRGKLLRGRARERASAARLRRRRALHGRRRRRTVARVGRRRTSDFRGRSRARRWAGAGEGDVWGFERRRGGVSISRVDARASRGVGARVRYDTQGCETGECHFIRRTKADVVVRRGGVRGRADGSEYGRRGGDI